MKFSMQEQVNPTNVFQLEVLFMHGDGDGYTTKVYTIKGLDPHNATEGIEFFQACIVAHSHGMGGDDGYWEIPGYYFPGEEAKDQEDDNWWGGQWQIPQDSEYCDGHATVREIKMFWYTGAGVKHAVGFSDE
jgi:hypothetical protein